ncbi:MAG TPA: hypothetical protein VM118_10300 [Acidobacteriota bacterium]|nr:hypothetical protein [Acidobacteriota bacterium]
MKRVRDVVLGVLCIWLMAGSVSAQQTTIGPEPPPGTDRGLESVKMAPVIIPGVPPYIWHHGCGPTSVGMIVGFWDRLRPDLVPGDATLQTVAVDAMIADDSESQICGGVASDHYQDYSCPKDASPGPLEPDRSQTGGAHVDNCVGDFMHTSWSAAGNYYGWSWNADVPQAFIGYVNSVDADALPVAANYSFDWFSWEDYKWQIDNARPVGIIVDTDGDGGTDHFVTGIGYDDATMQYGIYDTWDTQIHWYAWRSMMSGRTWGIYGVTTFYFESNDMDDDGVLNEEDNCPTVYNPGQEDPDGDGIGDACDNCPGVYNACEFDPLNDADCDGYCAEVDNCPTISNPGQEDGNTNGIGDACECTSPNYTFTGGLAGYRLGWRVSGAGDVNDDGYDDMIVGRHGLQAAATDPGQAYVYSGYDGALLYTFTGEAARDWFGHSVAGVGDRNGDGFDDVAVGAIANDAATFNAGRVYVFHGGAGPFPISVGAADADLILSGSAAGDYFGTALASVGDLDGDTVPELLVGAEQYSGAPGYASLYSGRTGAFMHMFTGDGVGDLFGHDVAGAGDVDNDGTPDLIIGAQENDAGGDNAGRAYVYSGQTYTPLHTFTGTILAGLGESVGGVGDVDDDGHDDVIVGAPRDNGGVLNSGAAYVYSGHTGDLVRAHHGSLADDAMGTAVAGLGDIDGDGFRDYGVSAAGALDVFVYSGRYGTLLMHFEGEFVGDLYGTDLADAGDLNADGIADLAVGAYWNDAGGANAGRAYAYFLGDVDSDVFAAGCDNCPLSYNPTQSDGDGDGTGDACDVCACDCHADPQCDAVADVLDVVKAIGVAFRSAPPIPDPNPECFYATTDVDCNGLTDVIDIVRMINVIFRSGDPAAQFCEPCAP